MKTFNKIWPQVITHMYPYAIHQVWGQAWADVVNHKFQCSDQIWRYVCFQIWDMTSPNILNQINNNAKIVAK